MMTMNASPYASNPMMQMQDIVKTLHDCAAVCERTTNLVLAKPDVHSRMTQLQLMRDCADMCVMFETYMTRQSPFSKHTAELCAYICECCGHECMKFQDHESQMCAQTCFKCARECRAFAMK
jgi:hypothetical protein